MPVRLTPRPAPLEMFTIRPQCAAFMAGATAWLQWNAPSRFTPTIARQSASVTCSSGRPTCPATPPASFTSTSIRPRAANVSLAMACTAARSVTSSGRASSEPPSAAASFAVAANSSASTSQPTTWAPRSASASAIARPRPCAAPVTMAVRPSKRISIVPIALLGRGVQEVVHRAHEQPRLVHERHVAAVREHDELGARDGRVHWVRDRGVALVVIAGGDERGYLERLQPVRVLDAREVAVNHELAVRAPHFAIEVPRHDAVGDRVEVGVRMVLVEVLEVAAAPRVVHVARRVAALLPLVALPVEAGLLRFVDARAQVGRHARAHRQSGEIGRAHV